MIAPPTRSSPTVFVVYAGPDAAVAGQLTAALNAAGIDATYDKDLLPGDIWDVELPRLLDPWSRQCPAAV